MRVHLMHPVLGFSMDLHRPLLFSEHNLSIVFVREYMEVFSRLPFSFQAIYGILPLHPFRVVRLYRWRLEPLGLQRMVGL